MKYTVEQLADENIVIYIANEEEYNKISKLIGINITHAYYGSYTYSINGGSYNSSGNRKNPGFNWKGRTVIGIEDIDFGEVLTGYKIIKEYPFMLGIVGDILPVQLQEEEWSNEFFEPVYKEIFKVGDLVVTFDEPKEELEVTSTPGTGWIPNSLLRISRIEKYGSNTVYFFSGRPHGIWNEQFRRATLKDIEETNSVIIGSYKAEIKEGEIAFGCQRFTKNDLLSIKHLLNEDIQAEITIRGTKITMELIDKLLYKLP